METILTYSSTCPVTIINKILNIYKPTSNDISKGLFDLAGKIDLTNVTGRVPIFALYELAEWIEKHLGPANVKMIGNLLGEEAYQILKQSGKISEKIKPAEAIEKFVIVSQTIFQDPLRRYWEKIEIKNNIARVKKCVLLNVTMQIGIFEAFLRKCGVPSPRVRLIRDYKRGQEFDEFEITWY
jgi:hypothetical protein